MSTPEFVTVAFCKTFVVRCASDGG